MSAPTESSTAFLAWSVFERGLQLVVSLVVGAAVARYLGPSDFGSLNAAWAVVALCWPLAQVGYPVVVRDLVREPHSVNEILGTALALNTVGAAIALIIYCGAAALYLGTTSSPVPLLAVVFALSLLAQPLGIADLYFQARRETALPSIARSIAILVSGGGRLLIVAMGGGLVAIGWTMVGDVALPLVMVMGSLWWLRNSSPFRWSVSRSRWDATTKRSIQLLVAGVSVAIYMRIDQVMIDALSSSSQAGLYAAAVRISEGPYVLSLLLLRVASPTLLRLRDTSTEAYETALTDLLARLAIAAVAITAFLAAFPGLLMGAIFGNGFSAGATVLRIHSLSMIFVFLGVGQSMWFITEGRELSTMRRSLSGAGINVALNFALIPHLGAAGAAWATLIAYAATTVASNVLFPSSRPLALLQWKALSPRRQVSVLRADLMRLRGASR